MRYWKFTNPDGTTSSVQSCSNDDHKVPNAVEITEQDFNAFIDLLPKPTPVQLRDLAAEIDDIKARVEKLEGK